MKVSVHSPFSGELVGQVTSLTLFDADAMAARSLAAFGKMRALSSYRRSEILRGTATLLARDHTKLSLTLAAEAGKPLLLARGEVDRAIATFTAAAEEAKRLGGEIMPIDVTAASEAYEGSFVRVPTGPVLGIAPFNFPLNLVAHKVAPALAVGASILLKPAPQTPLTALALAELVREAGAPGDALLVCPAEVDAAEAWVRDPRFALLSFTGSDKVGFHLKSIAGKKKALLELGGNAAAIVCEDAPDVPFAARRLAQSAFGYAGQVCIKTQRILVHQSVASEFTEAFLAASRALAFARNVEDQTNIVGPLIDDKSAARVASWVDEATQGGAEPLLMGAREGRFMGPTVLGLPLADVSHKVVSEEIFGPVAVLSVYSAWDEAVSAVNASRYGLQAAVFTDSHSRVHDAYARLEVGGVIVNDATNVRVDVMPYGGMKDSGSGREGVRFAMAEMTEPKMLVVRRG
jgi:glyceraldehyde-3-phosphate dehydrogenase (NADP+)